MPSCLYAVFIVRIILISPKEKIKEARSRWCRIDYQGTRGWVAGRYLREGACEPEK